MNPALQFEKRFGALLEAAPDATVIIDNQGTVLLANSHAGRMFGYDRQQLTGRPVETLVPEQYRAAHREHRRHFSDNPAARPMGGGNARLIGLRADGGEFPIDISLSPLEIDGQRLVVAAIRDMSARQDVEDKLRELSIELEHSRAGLQAVLDSLSEGVIVLSLEGEVLTANPAAMRMHGIDRKDDIPRTLPEMAREFHVCRLDGSLLPADQWPIARLARGESFSDVELEIWRFGSVRPWIGSYSGAPVLDNTTGQPMFGVCTIRDITERKQTEDRIRQAGLHDTLTGLPNRALLFEYSRHIFAHTQRSHHSAAILFIDLDRFKPINDTYGHEVGDAVLQEVARRIRKCTRQEDIAFRLGGDEFLIILPDIQDGAYAGDVARHVTQCINQPFHIDALELWLSSSIGISIYPRDGQDVDSLINQADIAMYHAKQSGRNRYQFYSSALAERANMQSRIENQLKAALMHQEFRLDYQPVVDMNTAQVISVEALLRWPYEDIGPDHFVPVAESTGLIGTLGKWVLNEACRQHHAWIEHGLPAIPIAINVSAVQFRQSDFVDQVSQTIRTQHMGAGALQLELTETALMEDLDRAIEQLAQMKALGFKIALDDFGTGYSSLSYLSRLPIDKIKVDKSFVYRIESDVASRTITDAIIALGRTLHLEIVAEGIESATVLQYLRARGCNHAQGFYVCEPVAADEFESWYRKREQAVACAGGF